MRNELYCAGFKLALLLGGCEQGNTPARAEPPRPSTLADAAVQHAEAPEGGAPVSPAPNGALTPNPALLGLYKHRIRVRSPEARGGFEHATNCLLVLEHAGHTWVGLETYGFNSHGCVLTAELVEDAAGTWLDVNQGCRIELEISRASIRLKRDVPTACSDEPCGASVSAVGAVFPRKLRKPVPAQRDELCGALHDVLRGR